SRRRYLHSFPTRRSSDLADFEDVDAPGLEIVVAGGVNLLENGALALALFGFAEEIDGQAGRLGAGADLDAEGHAVVLEGAIGLRSEEHTSELQSRVDLVC